MSKNLRSFGFVGLTFLFFGVGAYAADVPEFSALAAQNTPVPGFTTAPPASITTDVQDIPGYPTPIGENSGVLSEANRFYQAKRFFDAEKLYNAYVNQNAQIGVSTDLALAYHRLGLIAKRRQLYDKAQEYLISAIKSDPMKDPQITLDYAVILYDLGEYERAEKFFRFLNDNNPNLEEAKIYLGKTLLEVNPSIEILPLLEAEYSRVEAGELLAARCRAVGKTEEAEKLEKMISNEKSKGDEVFFTPAAPAPVPTVAPSMANEPPAPATPSPSDNSAEFEAFAATLPPSSATDGPGNPGFAPFETGNETGTKPAFAAAQDALGVLSSGQISAAHPKLPAASKTATLGGYPGLTMGDDDGVVLHEADPVYSEAEPVGDKIGEQFAPFEDYESDASATFAGGPRGVTVPRTEDHYRGFDGYLPPEIPSPKPASNDFTRVSVGSAPTPDFGFVDEICFHDPEKVALQPQVSQTPKPAAPVSVRTSPKASPLTAPNAKPSRGVSAPRQPAAENAHRLSSAEKLQMAEQAGAKITYLTQEQYNNEIATRAGRVVQHAEEEISNSNLQEGQKQALLQKILGL